VIPFANPFRHAGTTSICVQGPTSGVIATPIGLSPTAMVAVTVLVAVSITDTLSESALVT
jgi:hypothetical protein